MPATIIQSSEAYQIQAIAYTAESASVPGLVYTVTVDDGGWHCSCKASEYTKTRGKCWHLLAAQNGDLGKPKLRVRPLASTACALCGRTDTAKVTSAGYMGTDPDALICRDWRECRA